MPGTFAAADEVAALLEAMVAVDRGVSSLVPAGISGEMGGDRPGAIDPGSSALAITFRKSR